MLMVVVLLVVVVDKRQGLPTAKIIKEPVFGNARILANTSKDSQQKMHEAIEIREIRPTINNPREWALTGKF